MLPCAAQGMAGQQALAWERDVPAFGRVVGCRQGSVLVCGGAGGWGRSCLAAAPPGAWGIFGQLGSRKEKGLWRYRHVLHSPG